MKTADHCFVSMSIMATGNGANGWGIAANHNDSDASGRAVWAISRAFGVSMASAKSLEASENGREPPFPPELAKGGKASGWHADSCDGRNECSYWKT